MNDKSKDKIRILDSGCGEYRNVQGKITKWIIRTSYPDTKTGKKVLADYEWSCPNYPTPHAEVIRPSPTYYQMKLTRIK